MIPSGYEVKEEIGGHKLFCLYRAIRSSDGHKVLIKTPRSSMYDEISLPRLKREFEIGTEICVKGVVPVIEHIEKANSAALVFDDPDAVPASDLLTGAPLDLETALMITSGLADIISAIHQQGLIHLNLLPENIWYDAKQQAVYLTGLGGASRAPRGLEKNMAPRIIEGSLAYTSPEQTGRTARVVDYRADFYAFGVIFYKMLTGQLPFRQDEPLALIHAHVAMMPEAVVDILPAIPQTLSNIILKLLSKQAELRYQSASGLKMDLERALSELKKHGTIYQFPLGQDDYPARFELTQRLYGRKTERKLLSDVFEKAAKGLPQVLQVSGPPGVGKTVLVQRLQRMVLLQNGYFLSTKWSEFENNGQYNPAAGALQQILQHLLTEEEANLDSFRKELMDEMETNLRVLVDFFPLARAIAGDLPDISPLTPEDNQLRLYHCIRQFLKVVTRKRPLVIFYDDLQWADESSLDFIRGVFGKVSGRIMVVCGFRNEAAVIRNLDAKLLHPLRDTSLNITNLNVQPLSKKNVTRLIADTLQADEESVRTLAEKVYRGTAGNPYSVKNVLISLWEDSLKISDKKTWDLKTVGRIKTPGSVEELTQRRFASLSKENIRVISIAAALNLSVDTQDLAMVCNIPKSEVEEHLITACREHILIQQGKSFRFEHDQIRERAYMMIPAKKRPGIHFKIAQALKHNMSGSGHKIFVIADHLNKGLSLLKREKERAEAARINLEAAQMAKSGAAFPAADQYFEKGLEALGENAWKKHYNLALALHNGAAETAFLTADFKRANALSEMVHQNAVHLLDQIQAFDLQISIDYARRGEIEALKFILSVLRSLGVEISRKVDEKTSNPYIARILEQMKVKAAEPEEKQPEMTMTDPTMQAAMRLMRRAFLTSVWVDSDLGMLLIVKLIEITLQYGYCPESSFAFVLAGNLLCARLNDIDGGRKVASYGLRLSQHPEAESIRPVCRMMYHMTVSPWYEHPDAFREELAKVYQEAMKAGKFITAGYAAIAFSGAGFWTGMSLEELEPKVRAYYDDAVQHGMERIQGGLLKIHEVVTSILGRPELTVELVGSRKLVSKIQYKLEEDADHTAKQISRACEMIVSFILRRHDQAYDLSLELKGQPMTSGGGALPLDTYACLSLLGQHKYWESKETSSSESAENLNFIKKRLKLMQVRANAAPMNYQHRVDLIMAELYRVQGKTHKAIACYEHSIKAAEQQQFMNELAFANELAGEFYLEIGGHSVAALHFKQASLAYSRWGAQAKVKSLNENYPELLKQREPKEFFSQFESELPYAGKMPDLDLTSIRMAVQALSLELDLERLIQKLMNILLQNVAAQKGFFLKEGANGVELVASISVDNPVVEFPLQIQLEHCDLLSRGIVRYVNRTGKPVVIGNAAEDTVLLGDAYIQKQAPKSILCVPVVNQGRSIGILYLENNLMADAFTAKRLSVVNLIFSQAAASLENAQLHENLKQEVMVRRKAEEELRSALTDVAGLKDRLEAENIYLRQEIKNSHGFEEIIGESKALKQAFYKIDMVAATKANVLIQGETGTGKELVARAIHDASPRREGPFISVNCAALPAGLIESELFGHEKGAFTGALERKAGRFELADKGTIFLDEIGDLPLELQAKLLRVLQESEFERLGSARTIRVDVRVVAATNRDLEKETRTDRFRSDLYYRLSVFPIDLPPLRERKSDIPLLVSHFVSKKAQMLAKKITRIPQSAMTALKQYHWPGNVRELENVIERAMILSPGQVLVLDESFAGGQSGETASAERSDDAVNTSHKNQRLETVERQHILKVIEASGWKIKGKNNAAERLGLHPSTLKSRMKKLGIERP